MILRKLLAGLILLLVLLGLGLVVYLSVTDFGKFKHEIEQAVSDATGRQFHVEGALHVRLLPAPSVMAEDITLSNAPWSAAPDILRIGHFSARIGLWSLLFPPVEIRDIRLRDATLLLEVNEQGDGNWRMGGFEPESTDAGKKSGEPFRMPVDIRFAEISNVDIRYRAVGADGARLQLASLDIQTDESGLHVLEGQGLWSERPFTIEGAVADRTADLDVTLDRIELRSSAKLSDGSVDFSAALGALDELGRIFGIENLPAKPLTLNGSVALQGDSVRLSNVLATLGSSRIIVDGNIGTGDIKADLAIDASGPSLAELDPQLPGIAFSVQANVVQAGTSLRVDPISAAIGASELSGSLELPQGTPGPIIARASAALIDLKPFLSAPSGEAEGSRSDAPTAQPRDAYVFTTEPLPIDLLRQLSADVAFTVARLKTSADEFHDLRLVARAGDGALVFEQQFRGPKGGDYRGQATLAVAGDGVDLTLSAKAEELRLGLLSGPDAAVESIPATSMAMDVTASGGTARALAASTNGRILITSGPGVVENELMEKVSGDLFAKLFQALNPLADQEAISHWQCTVFSLDFTDGLGEVGGFLMQSDKLMIVGRGEIDLRTEHLNLEFNTKPREGVGLSADMFVTPFVKLSGTLANPAIGLNKSGAVVSGGAAVLTGGMSFLFKGVMDRASAREDKCAQTLEAVGAGLE